MLRRSLDIRFRAVSSMNLESGLLSLENFKAAVSSMQRQPKLEAVRGTISQLEKNLDTRLTDRICSAKLWFCLYIFLGKIIKSIGINSVEQIVPYWSYIFWYA